MSTILRNFVGNARTRVEMLGFCRSFPPFFVKKVVKLWWKLPICDKNSALGGVFRRFCCIFAVIWLGLAVENFFESFVERCRKKSKTYNYKNIQNPQTPTYPPKMWKSGGCPPKEKQNCG